MEITEAIIAAEWEQFGRVENEGGRAACQDDWPEFYLMRASQFCHWPEEALESWYADLQEAERRGWNLFTEKYARMMETTAPEAFLQIQGALPPLSEEKRCRIDEIAAVQLAWYRQCRERYPALTAHGRALNGGGPGWASADVYLRGELATYSERTLGLYWRHIRAAEARGENLVEKTLAETVRGKGYASLAAAEERMSKNKSN